MPTSPLPDAACLGTAHTADTAALVLQDVAYGFAGWPAVLAGVSLQVRAGSVTCLLGRSGCGKSTLLQLAAGLLVPQRGRVWVQGEPVQAQPQRVGLVFQNPTLLDWLDVLDNVLLPVSLQGRVRPAHRQAALDALARLGLSALRGQRPWQLSGGQQSRVALARALLLRPAVLLMDEPFAALDALTREELQHELLQMCHSQGTAVLFVTHDIAEAVVLGDEVLLLHNGALAHRQSADAPLAQRAQPSWRDSPACSLAAAALRAAMNPMAGPTQPTPKPILTPTTTSGGGA